MAAEGEETRAWKERPLLDEYLAQTLENYMLLSSSRINVMGEVGAIPVSEIKAFLDLIGVVDLEDRWEFLMIVKGLDDHYLKDQKRRRPSKR